MYLQSFRLTGNLPAQRLVTAVHGLFQLRRFVGADQCIGDPLPQPVGLNVRAHQIQNFLGVLCSRQQCQVTLQTKLGFSGTRPTIYDK